MTIALVGTNDGFQAVGVDMPRLPRGHAMTAVARTAREVWAISDRNTVWRDSGYGDGAPIASYEDLDLHCVLPIEDRVLVGASKGTILELLGLDLVHIESFDEAPGRDDWYTPWGGPPDVRSMAAGSHGALYVNVHVGGVVRSRDGGHTWQDTMDIDADVHQVIAHPNRRGYAYVASARGLGVTANGGDSWAFSTDGLHASYCRAIAISDEMLFVSAATGPGGSRSALYRRPIEADGPLLRCDEGLPEWFSDNIDTFCIAAKDKTVIAADPNGTVFRSDDDGATWEIAASDLPGAHCVAIM